MIRIAMRWVCALAVVLAAGLEKGTSAAERLGAEFRADGSLRVAVFSSRATRLEVWLYHQAKGAAEKLVRPLVKDAPTNVWSVQIPQAELQQAGLGGVVYYGLRAWGPNWPHDAGWSP